MTRRTRNSIPMNMSDPLAQVTDLGEIIERCLVPNFEKQTVRICSYDGGLIRNSDRKPYYLTEFQKGYLHALLSLPQFNLQGTYICKKVDYENHIMYRTDGICANCRPRLDEMIKKYKKERKK